MKKNGIQEAWNNGKNIVNGWSSIANTFNSEILAVSGFDSVTIDMQHGLVGYQKVVEMLQAISGYNITPMVRVPWNDPSMVMRCLDAGAYGIICPMVNTKEECEKFVAACRYPPKGNRSFGPIRARMYAGDDYFKHANDTLLNFAMIETSEAVDNLDKILSVEELDAVYIGPSDLAVTMGYAPGAYEKEVEDCLSYIIEMCKKKNIKAGIHCPDGKTVKERFDMGYNLGTISADAALLSQASKREIADAKN
ncbi:MAG: 2,4-dihydroxyhept-2-ene-1,7-dioic acid aldolase [Pelagibacterales bacterium]|jgi:4-hydroxy-2-oxoheptanedioate aldolase|nr:2,4-dihydroxyhept-2-ene-1,7-dioic acid aldolase [Pelagibacterales bacterium]